MLKKKNICRNHSTVTFHEKSHSYFVAANNVAKPLQNMQKNVAKSGKYVEKLQNLQIIQKAAKYAEICKTAAKYAEKRCKIYNSLQSIQKAVKPAKRCKIFPTGRFLKTIQTTANLKDILHFYLQKKNIKNSFSV